MVRLQTLIHSRTAVIYIVGGWLFITCEGGGAAILLGGQNLDCFWGVIFRKGSVTWGVILGEVV